MRILYIASGYLPYTFSENLCNGKLVYAMKLNGWDVDVISRVDEGPAYSSEWKDPWLPLKDNCYEIKYEVGVKFERLFDLFKSMLLIGYPVNGVRWASKAYKVAIKLIKKNSYDVIITRSPNDIPHIIGYKLSKKFGIKWIANWNDPASTIWPEPYTHKFCKIKTLILNSYNKKCLKNADINTFPSESLMNHFIEHYPFLKEKKSIIIPHIAMPESLIHKIKYEKKDKMYLCHSGNLSKERNPELLFKAIKKLIDDGYNKLQLDVMGQVNDYTKDLINKYNLDDYVKLVGSFPYIKALDKMQEYDVFVLLEAKLEKGIFFASKFTDYAQLGRPILAISPSIGFAKDTITKYGGGICTDNTNEEDIKNGLLKLYNSWQSNHLLEDYPSENLYANFSAEHIINIYKSIL